MSNKHGFVIYSDGGASDPYAGYGLHGYYYEITENKKGAGHPKFVPTRKGYKLKSVAKPEDTAQCKIIEYFDGYGALTLKSTNNMAEITGLIRGYELVLASIEKGLNVVEVTFLLDSEYTLKSATEWLDRWIKRDFVKHDGSVVKNRSLWETVKDLKTQVEEKVPSIEYIHVKSHQPEDVELGNNTADRLASVGQMVARKEMFKDSLISQSADGYWKYQPERHPLLSYKYCYFQTSADKVTNGVYFTGNQSFEPHLFGQRSWDNAFAIIELTNPDKLVDELRLKCVELADGYTKPAMVRMADLYNPTIHRDIVNFGIEALGQPNEFRCDLLAGQDTPIVRDFVPPMIANYGMESLTALNTVFNLVKEGNPTIRSKDLTAMFYDVAEKPEKTTLKAEIRNGVSEFDVKIPYMTIDGKERETKITLLFGVDIPVRNALKRIETMKPKIEIKWWPVLDGNSFRYAVYVETEDAKSIWAAVDSNTRILC